MDSISETVTEILTSHNGMVLGGNDLLYTNTLEQHPFSYFVYKYGRLLAYLGVDTLFIENHYISEPIQTRGFIGYMMYCAYLFNFRIIGMEFKGTTTDYFEHTGKRVSKSVTTIAYDEYNRLLRLNYVTKDVVGWKMDPARWTEQEGRRSGKYLLFCGMSHVNNEKGCKGIKTLLNVPGIGVMFSDHDAITKLGTFRDTSSSYRRPTDYLIELNSVPEIAMRLHIDSTIFTTLYEFFFFYQAYSKLMENAGKKTTVKGLWQKSKYQAYPLPYNDMANYVMKYEPLVRTKEYKRLCSVVSTYLCDICTRQLMRDSTTGMTEEDMSELITNVLLFVEKKMGRGLQKKDFQPFMDLIFLEKKKMPLPNTVREFLSLLTVKFKKQLNRPENHLYHLFLIMNSLDIPLPKTRALTRLFHKVLDTK